MTEQVDARTDEVLLHAIAQQDSKALIELYRRYGGQGLALARRCGLPGSTQVVEDGFFMLFYYVDGFSRCSLPPAVWILGVLQRHYHSSSSGSAS